MNIALAVILVALMVPALIFLARDLERSRRNSEQIHACARDIQEAADLSAEVIAMDLDAPKSEREALHARVREFCDRPPRNPT